MVRLRDDDPMARSVLIVDDHPRFLIALRRMLEGDGWNVAGEATDGGSAIAQAAALKPDVVLLDVGLPDVSGLQVATELRASMPGVGLVLMSTRDAADYRQLAASHGADGFIAKAELSGTALDDLLAASGR